jgi:acetylornithine deacetylase/succinyl-diaminopimelate desuccinylase-like protein
MLHLNRRATTVIGLAGIVALGQLAGACAATRPPSTEVTTPALIAMQTRIVSTLAGDAEIRPGLKLANRTTPENKVAARTYLANLLTQFGLVAKRQAYSAEGENVYALLSCGRPSAELVVVGAHYDSARNSPGANDDATGVAAVAALVEQLVRVTRRTRDVAFVFFDEEERGLRGSRAFAQWLKDEKRPVHSVHTIDQMGWDQDGDRAIELELPYEGARELYAAAAAALKMTIQMHVTTEAGSDHSAFRRLGFNAVGITEEYRNKDTTPFIHRPGDTANTVNFDYLASTTRLFVKVIETLATALPGPKQKS